MKVIVLDGELKSALAIVRSLGRAGVTVSVGATRASGMALHSRYASARFTYPSVYEQQETFIEVLKAEAIRLGGKPAVFACSDVTFLSLYAYRTVLQDYVTLRFPSDESLELAFNKAATYSLAKVSSVPTIPTYIPVTTEEVTRLSRELTYPVVMKPARSVTWYGGRGVYGSARFIHTGEELIRSFDIHRATFGEPPLIQPFLRGEEYGVEMLAHAGEPYALITHHRVRSLSPTGGAATLKETVMGGDLRTELETAARTLVKKLVWEGPIMVEFKVDSDTREPKLMEINGRFWGSLPLAVAAGVDVPLLYYHALDGEMFPPACVVGREGVVTRHILGDVQHLFRVLFAHDLMRATLYPQRAKALRDFCTFPRGTMSDVWSFSDPKPACMELVDTLKKRLWK